MKSKDWYWTLVGVIGLFAGFVSPHTRAETIMVGGPGSLTPLVKLLGAEYMKKNPGTEVSVVHPPLGTGGSLKALSAGHIDIALIGRLDKPDEETHPRPWLQTPVVLVTNDGKSNGLTSSEIADIYGGRRTKWDDGHPIRLVLRGEYESETKSFRTLSPAVDTAVGEALRRPGFALAENDLVAVELLSRISGSLGTTSLGLLKTTHSRLTLLPIDGVLPSAKAAEAGSYRLQRQYYLVLSSAPRPAATAFAQWLLSPVALAVARRFEYLPFK